MQLTASLLDQRKNKKKKMMMKKKCRRRNGIASCTGDPRHCTDMHASGFGDGHIWGQI